MLRAAAHAGFEPKKRSIDSVSFDVILSAVAQGLGVAILPQLARIGEHRGVEAYPLTDVPLRRKVFAATREGSRGNPAVMAVLDALSRAAADVSKRL